MQKQVEPPMPRSHITCINCRINITHAHIKPLYLQERSHAKFQGV